MRGTGERLLPTGSLDVADDGTGLVVHELDANLGDTTARACGWESMLAIQPFAQLLGMPSNSQHTGAAEHAGDLDKLDGSLGCVHFERFGFLFALRGLVSRRLCRLLVVFVVG
jgi:hypothetical protein